MSSSCRRRFQQVGIFISILLMLGMNVYFTYYALDNFHEGYDEPLAISNMTNDTTETTTTTASYYHNSMVPPEVQEYLNEWNQYSKYFNKAQNYIVFPCCVSAFFIFSLFVFSWGAPDVFKSTTPLFYTTFTTILTLASIVVYMNLAEIYYEGPNYMNVGLQVKNIAIMGSIMIFGSFSMSIIFACLLTKKSWSLPTLSKILTFDKAFEISKLTLNIYAISMLCDSHLFFNGMKNLVCSQAHESWCHHVPFPCEYGYGLLCCLSCGLIASSTAILSGVIGTTHKWLETLVSFLMTVGLGFSIVVTSSLFLHSFLKMSFIYSWGYHEFSLYIGCLFALSLFHFIFKLAAPNIIHKSPAFVSYIDGSLSLPTTIPIHTMSAETMGKLKVVRDMLKNKFLANVLMLALSFTAMCLGASYHSCDFWRAVCIAADTVTVVSSLSNLAQIKANTFSNDTIKNLCQTCIEITILSISGIAMLIDAYDFNGKFAGALSMLCAVLYMYRFNSEFQNRKFSFISLFSKNNEVPLLNDQETNESDTTNNSDGEDHTLGNSITSTAAADEEDNSPKIKIDNLHDVI